MHRDARTVDLVANMRPTIIDISKCLVFVVEPSPRHVWTYVDPAESKHSPRVRTNGSLPLRARHPVRRQNLVGVERYQDTGPIDIEASRGIDQQFLARLLVISRRVVIDQRDLVERTRDLSAPIGRLLVGHDDMVGPGARALQEPVEDPGLILDRRHAD